MIIIGGVALVAIMVLSIGCGAAFTCVIMMGRGDK